MKNSNRAVTLYLIIVAAVCYGLGIAEMIFRTGVFYEILQKGFTLVPVTVAFIVRRLTGDKNPVRFSLKVWKDWKMWLFSALVPAAAIVLARYCISSFSAANSAECSH